MQSILRGIAKYVIGVAALLVSLLLILLLIVFIRYPNEYVIRVLKWRDADVFDYQKFPERVLEPPPVPFVFTENIDEEYVRRAFREAVSVTDLDEMLRNTKTQAFLVIKNDTIVYEKYFNNTERHSIVTSFSVAKSFASALIGKAISEGYLSGIDEAITNYIPELAGRDGRFRDITIRHLITMSSGIKYKEYPFGDDAKTYYYTDLRQLALEHTSIDRPPGERFHYNNYNPLLLGIVLERATGMTVTEYLQRSIWDPLGMEFPGSWSIDSETSGFEKMESGINARAIDFAKFGRLYLRRGNWEGVQILPEAWVDESTAPGPVTDYRAYYPESGIFTDGRGYYGYHWWGRKRGDGYDYSALGNHGQYIYISPKSNLIIVRHGERYGRSDWLRVFYEVAGYMAGE
jgi:CubicO group peptidase (beta-lactamase class C family)